ncbi:MAG: type IV pilus assembly protein PilM [Pseudomonadota bacterium]
MMSSGKRIVGVDIGSSSVKLVGLSRLRGGYHLDNIGIAPLPKDSVVDGEIFNLGATSGVLRELVNASKVKGATAYTGVFGSGVVVKRIKVPIMSKEELEHHIRWEAEQYIPFGMEEVNLDYDVITPNYKKSGKMDIVIAAAKKDLVSAYSAVLHDSGLVTEGIDIGTLALYDMYKENYAPNKDEASIILDIGASRTILCVIERDRAVFVREVEIAGEYLTQKIQEQLGITFEEGETLKVSGEEGMLPPEVEKILLTEVKKLGIDIRKGLDLYLATASELPTGEISVVGGGAKLIGVTNVIESITGLPTESVNPLKNIAFNEKVFPVSYLMHIAPFFGVSVGLAIRGLRYQ